MSQRERSVSSFSSSLLFPSPNSLRSDFQKLLLSLFLSFSPPLSLQPWIQFQSFMGLSEMYKWQGSLLSVLLCLLSSGECHILTLSQVPLLPLPSSVPFVCSPFPSLSRFSLCFTPFVPSLSLPPTSVFFTVRRYDFVWIPNYSRRREKKKKKFAMHKKVRA